MKYLLEAEVLEPEVLPPRVEEEPRTAENKGPGGIHPVLAGALIDLANVPLAGPAGLFIGGMIGYWAAISNRLPVYMAILLALAAGVYCALPLPRPVPLATLIGLIMVLNRRKP